MMVARAETVEPVLDQAAAERARLVNAERARLIGSGTSVTVETMADARQERSATVRKRLERRRERGQLITVLHGGNVLVPTFQLDAAFGFDQDAEEFVGLLLEHGMDAWAIWRWFETPNTWLDGRTPRAQLRLGDRANVRRAIAGMFQE